MACKQRGYAISDNKVDTEVVELTCLTARSLLGFNSSLLTHSREDNNVGILLISGEELINLLANFSIRNLNIVLGLTIIGHQGEESIIGNIEQLVFLASNIGNVHVVGGGAKFFEFLASEDIDSNKMDLGVTVLASLGGGHVDDLARAVLDANEAVLSQGRALHGESGRGASIGGLESVFMLRVVRHLE